jgi:Domain of unknown function (DUF4148)
LNTATRSTPWVSLGALIIASTFGVAAHAQGSELTRAEVVSQTLAARANGSLTPAGEAPTPSASIATHSTVTRSELRAEVLAARAAGTLEPAGEGVEYAAARPGSASTVTRAEVKADVIAARRAGDLIPAGEGPDVETHAARANLAWRVRTADGDASTAQVAKK